MTEKLHPSLVLPGMSTYGKNIWRKKCWYRNECVLWQNNEEILSVLFFRAIIWLMLWIRANESDFFFLRIGNVYWCLWTLGNIKTLHSSVLLDLTFIKSDICPHRLLVCVRTTLQEQRCFPTYHWQTGLSY